MIPGQVADHASLLSSNPTDSLTPNPWSQPSQLIQNKGITAFPLNSNSTFYKDYFKHPPSSKSLSACHFPSHHHLTSYVTGTKNCLRSKGTTHKCASSPTPASSVVPSLRFLQRDDASTWESANPLPVPPIGHRCCQGQWTLFRPYLSSPLSSI